SLPPRSSPSPAPPPRYNRRHVARPGAGGGAVPGAPQHRHEAPGPRARRVHQRLGALRLPPAVGTRHGGPDGLARPQTRLLRVLVTDRGQRYTLVAALFYAPSVITIKQAILASNTAAGTFGTYLAASLIMTPLALTTSARHFSAVPRYWKEFLALGVFAALTTLSQGKAYTLTLSSYVEAVKQIEILFAMGVGVLFFGEAQRVRESALGGLVMLAGMVLLALAQ